MTSGPQITPAISAMIAITFFTTLRMALYCTVGSQHMIMSMINYSRSRWGLCFWLLKLQSCGSDTDSKQLQWQVHDLIKLKSIIINLEDGMLSILKALTKLNVLLAAWYPRWVHYSSKVSMPFCSSSLLEVAITALSKKARLCRLNHNCKFCKTWRVCCSLNFWFFFFGLK